MSSTEIGSGTTTGATETADLPDGTGGGGAPIARALLCVYSRKIDATTQGTNQTYIYNLKLIEIDGSIATYHRLLDEQQLDVDDATLNDTDKHLPTFPVETRLRFKWVPYDNTSAATKAQTGWVEVYYNGIRVARMSPDHTVHDNSTGNTFGGVMTSAGSTWCGIVCEGGQNGTATGSASTNPAKMFGGRFIRPQASVTPPLNPGSADVVAFTSAPSVDVGTLNIDRRLSPCAYTATALAGREVQTATMLTIITGRAATARTYVFAIDGDDARIIDPIDKVCVNWTNTTGTAELENCRVIGVWRGRFFLANNDSNPTFWALSKIVRASDDAVTADLWTTGGTDPTRAFKGTATDSPGTVASAVTAFAPFDNGRAFMGCASECYIFDDDPGNGGRLLKVTGETGCLGPRAVAFDEEGNLYFAGPAGVYMIQKGTSEVRNVTGNRLAAQLNHINTATTLVEMVYDSAKRSLMIYLTPRDLRTAGDHAVIETAENATWLDVLPLRMGPTAVCKIAGESGDDRRFLVGGSDGYIYRPITAKPDDDGDPIPCYVRYPSVESADATQRVSLVELQGTGAPGTGAADWEVRTDSSAAEVQQQALDGGVDPVASGTWFAERAGAQPPVRMRAGGGAIQVIVRQNSGTARLALERVTGRFKDLGPRRF